MSTALLAIQVALVWSVQAEQPAIVRLVSDPSALSLIDSVRPDRIGYSDSYGNVHVLDLDGKELRVEKLSRGYQPLYLTAADELVVQQVGPQVIDSKSAMSPEGRHGWSMFAQGNTIFYESIHGVLIQPAYRGPSTQSHFVNNLDSAGGVGIDRDASVVAVMRNPRIIPTIEIFRRGTFGEWARRDPPCPPTMDTGHPLSTVISYNDVRPVSPSTVLFFGRPLLVTPLNARFEIPSGVQAEERARVGALYLLEYDIGSSTCTAYVKMTVSISTELLRERVGRLSVSSDGRHLFLLINGTIWKIPYNKVPSGGQTRLASNETGEVTTFGGWPVRQRKENRIKNEPWEQIWVPWVMGELRDVSVS